MIYVTVSFKKNAANEHRVLQAKPNNTILCVDPIITIFLTKEFGKLSIKLGKRRENVLNQKRLKYMKIKGYLRKSISSNYSAYTA